MTDKTATEADVEMILRERLLQLHRHFRNRYAPRDPRERDQFEAELAMLMHETAIEVMAPLRKAMAAQLMNPPSMIITKPEETSR